MWTQQIRLTLGKLNITFVYKIVYYFCMKAK